MTVKELVEKLQQLDQEMEVTTDDYDYWVEWIVCVEKVSIAENNGVWGVANEYDLKEKECREYISLIKTKV